MDPGVRQAAINLVKAKRATEGINRYVPTPTKGIYIMLCAFSFLVANVPPITAGGCVCLGKTGQPLGRPGWSA